MKKIFKLLALMLCMVPLLLGCANATIHPIPSTMPSVHRIGIPFTKTMRFQAFHSIKTFGFYNIHIDGTPGYNDYKLTVTGDKAVVQNIVMKVKKNVLYLYMKPGYHYFETGDVDIKIHMPTLHLLDYSGVGNVDSVNLNSNSLVINNHGNGRINLQGVFNLKELYSTGVGITYVTWVDSRHLKIRAINNGHLFLAGIADSVDVSIANNVKLNAKYLRAQDAFINTTDCALAEVYVLNSLSALASGYGNIYYYSKLHFLAPYMRESGSIMSMYDIGPY